MLSLCKDQNAVESPSVYLCLAHFFFLCEGHFSRKGDIRHNHHTTHFRYSATVRLIEDHVGCVVNGASQMG